MLLLGDVDHVESCFATFGDSVRSCLDAQKGKKILHSNCHIESLDAHMEH
jgi:hypothetical protein